MEAGQGVPQGAGRENLDQHLWCGSVGKRSEFPGVEIHQGKVRIHFRLAGKLHRKSLGLDPTRANLKHAARLADEIRRSIKSGTFFWSHYWQDDSQTPQTSAPTFLDLSRQYIASASHLAPATVEGYRKILNTYYIPWLGNLPVDEITYGALARLVNERDWGSNKTRNNALTPLKGIFELAFLDGHVETDPTARLRAVRSQKPTPDPLTIAEVDSILDWLTTRPAPFRSYFELACFTGLRTSELIAIQWGDIDWHRLLLRVQRAKVRGQIKGTKTAQVRDVELNDKALSALVTQKAETFLAGDWIFRHPATGEPFNNDKPPRLVFSAALKALGIRHRSAYQTRHTYATLNLMAGANPMWVSRQMGHANMRMTLERYSRWIDGECRGESAKIDQYLGNITGNKPGKPVMPKYKRSP